MISKATKAFAATATTKRAIQIFIDAEIDADGEDDAGASSCSLPTQTQGLSEGWEQRSNAGAHQNGCKGLSI
jgi:hypothetical protein